MHIIVSLLLLSVAIFALAAVIASRPRGQQLQALANVAEGFYPGRKSYKTDAAIGTRYLLGKIGTDAAHIAVAGAADIPIGFISDESAGAEELVNVDLLGTTCETKIGVASAAIAAGAMLVPDAGGKVRTLPAGAGTYYIIGRALSAAAANNDEIELDPCFPTQRVVA